ncbi:hypothetical protein NQ317_014104 [Molorchus minor]|uniref:C2H2-type domain-containing protein n=1 Tax=Molorchus minor TaxID=1323400 RepID=A0ABQ9IUB1_9CUCU|nr:hypothetical protein NQ317_014104 [Molorchus minor]
MMTKVDLVPPSSFRKTGKKAKKPLQTTLGKAAVPDEKEVDLSHVQKPIHTSVFGLTSPFLISDCNRGSTKLYNLAQKVLNEDLSSKEVTETEVTIADQFKKNYSTNILLEEIATNNAAVFQTMIKNVPQQAVNEEEYMKSEVMEIHGILENDEAVLGSDGKIFKFQSSIVNKDTEAVIPKGNSFVQNKTLTYHIKYKHNSTRLVYICPDCKDSFANVWCVYRHLYKIHRKTLAQIKRMRDQINNSCVRRDQEPDKQNDKKVQERIDKTDEENQWLNNIEGDNVFSNVWRLW